TMQDQKTDINQQIQELRTIISLQGDIPLASMGCPNVRGLSACLLTLVSQSKHPRVPGLALGGILPEQKPRAWPLSSGCLVSLPCSPVRSHMCFQMAREKLQNDIFDRVNVCNMLLYGLRQRDRALDELRRQLLGPLGYPQLESSLLQVIRQLENNIEKTLMKVHTGQKVTTLYLAVRDALKKELAHLPLQLDVLHRMVEMYQGELKGMELMALDAFKATDTAKVRTWPRASWDPLPVVRANGDPAWTALGSQASESSCDRVEETELDLPTVSRCFCTSSCVLLLDLAPLGVGSSLLETPAVRKASFFQPSLPPLQSPTQLVT
uniref:Uncharacterized protein n=1 Tax=Apteryx owenii TaxID=8824 RepID=A0A8B9QIM7_APTOW